MRYVLTRRTHKAHIMQELKPLPCHIGNNTSYSLLQVTAQVMPLSRQRCRWMLGRCAWFMLNAVLTLKKCAVGCPSPAWSRRSWRPCCTMMSWSSAEKLAVAKPHRFATHAAQSCCAPLPPMSGLTVPVNGKGKLDLHPAVAHLGF